MSADPAGHGVRWLGRAATLGVLFAAELVGIALLYQFLANIECARTDAQVTCDLLRSLVTRALVVLAVLTLLIRSRPGSFSGFLASCEGHQNRPARITHAFGLVLMLVPLVMGWGGELSLVFQTALVPWGIGAALAMTGGLLWMAPWSAWKDLLWTQSHSSLPILAIAAVVPDIATRILPIWNWQAMTTVTFSAVAGVLQMVSDTVEIYPEDYLIGVGEFFVSVAPQCSGVEGFALVTAFVGFYAFIFRADIRVGRLFLVVLPLGLLLSWLLNVLRTGSYFGEMAHVKAGDIPRQATVETLTDALIAEFRPGAMKKLSVNCQLQLSQSLLNTVVDRLMFADERIAHV